MIVTSTGIAVVDIIAADLPHIAQPGEVVFGPRGNAIHMGGHTCNVTVDLVQMGLKGKAVSAIISVGKDPLGDFLVNRLTKARIVTHPLRSPRQTSSNLILVAKGEDRRFHVDVGANLDLDPKRVSRILRQDSPAVFHVGAAGWLGKLDDSLAQICAQARTLNSITFTSIIAPYGKDWSFITPALKHLDIFHCNNIEATAVTGKSDPVEATEALVKAGVKVALVTMGDKGLYARLPGQTVRLPAFTVDAVDPTGAGDAFCTGVMFKLATEPFRSILGRKNQLSNLALDHWKEILTYASACGAACCTAPGTTTAVKPPIIQKMMWEQSEHFTSKIAIL